MAEDLHIFDPRNVLKQLETAEFANGYYTLEFYVEENGRPSKVPTQQVSKFYLYPSGGTLRDANFQLLFYDSRYDTYRGFRPPQAKGNDSKGK